MARNEGKVNLGKDEEDAGGSNVDVSPLSIHVPYHLLATRPSLRPCYPLVSVFSPYSMTYSI